jgi:hypothetical protein
MTLLLNSQKKSIRQSHRVTISKTLSPIIRLRIVGVINAALGYLMANILHKIKVQRLIIRAFRVKTSSGFREDHPSILKSLADLHEERKSSNYQITAMTEKWPT